LTAGEEHSHLITQSTHHMLISKEWQSGLSPGSSRVHLVLWKCHWSIWQSPCQLSPVCYSYRQATACIDLSSTRQ